MTENKELFSIEEFEQLAKLTYRTMYRAALRSTENRQDAEDAVQESFLYFLNKLYKGSLYKVKPAFLARNAYLRGLDIVRKDRRQQLILANEKLGGNLVIAGESMRMTKGRVNDPRNPEGVTEFFDKPQKIDRSEMDE